MRLVAVVLAGWMAMCARAGTLDVPSQYPTIQTALDAAAAGDTIVVQPGTYPEALAFPVGAVTLLAPGGRDVTIIDASGHGTSAVSVVSYAGGTVVIDGFTITGGKGTTSATGSPVGGGVYQNGPQSVVLNGCRITGNQARYGGGISVASMITLTGCEVTDNLGSESGGGIRNASYLGISVLKDCVVRGNAAPDGTGGGLYGRYVLEDCLISQNTAKLGGGIYGAAVGQDWTGVVLAHNGAETGGGCHLEASLYADDEPGYVRGATFIGNTASLAGGALFLDTQGFQCPDSDANLIAECAFLGNTTAGLPLPIQSTFCDGGATRIENCCFVGEVLDGPYRVRNSILRGVAAPIASALEVAFCDVEGGWPGAGNIDADPLFADAAAGDLHLLPASPCRNAGDPGAAFPADAVDPDGDPRVLEGRVDMGMDEFADDCNGNGLLDWQDLADGASLDCEGDGVPDECEPWLDCNGNGVRDPCDIAAGTSGDCNANDVPDECEPFDDCNGNGVFDPCESGDCNANGVLDVCDIFAGTSLDSDGNGLPDECQQILLVPSGQPTIQAALDAAEDGDTILLEPGVHAGPGNLGIVVDKDVLVAGLTTAAECVIDCEGQGRAFSVAGRALGLRDLTIRGGSAGGGGAVDASDGASLEVLRCVLAGNESTFKAGGAIRLRGASFASLEGCVLAGNVSSTGGGGLGVDDGSQTEVVGCTFSGNGAAPGTQFGSGGSVRVAGGSGVVLRDSILHDGQAGKGAEIHVQGAASLVDVAFCDVEGGQAGVSVWLGAALGWGPGNLDADPLFKDAAAGDYRLSGGSPCIDAGDPAGAPDADGTPPDMGAIAFSPFEELGFALAGAGGAPHLQGTGTTIAGDPLDVTLSNAAPSAPATLVLGTSLLFAPFKGGVMVPDANLLIGPLPVAADGTLVLSAPWPGGVPSGTLLWIQAWVPDAGGPAGFAASNGLAVEAR